MPLSICTATDDQAFDIARKVYTHADRLIDVQINNGVVEIACDDNEEEEVMRQLIAAGIRNILRM